MRNRSRLNDLAAISQGLETAAGSSGGEFTSTSEGDLLQSVESSVVRLKEILRTIREDDFRLGITFSKLLNSVRSIRLQPVKNAFSTYPSFIRRSARDVGKKIEFELSGEDVGLDQGVFEKISDPLLHLVRNCISHGVEFPQERKASGKTETAVIRIDVRSAGELIRIEVADDGRGVDLNAVKKKATVLGIVSQREADKLSDEEVLSLLFASGFSTAEAADEMSGRGVGLDAVRATVEALGGNVEVHTKLGEGSQFVLMIPTTLSVIRGLLVKVAGQTFAIPNNAIVEVYRPSVKDVRRIDGRQNTEFRGKLLPLVRLREVLGLTGIKDIFLNQLAIAVLRWGDELTGFIIDAFIGEREVIWRPLPAFLGRLPLTSGVTLMETGEYVPILHVGELFGAGHTARGHWVCEDAATKLQEQSERRILYAEDSVITREYVASSLRSMGFVVDEVGDGAEALEALNRNTYDLLLSDLQM
ncbi:MAG: chemotaxis protein CheW, partial [Myxococcota bacterium]